MALQKIVPPRGLPRQLALQSAVVAVGWGVWLTGSVVFFKLYVGLSAVQIGIAFSIAGFFSLVLSMPLGHFADRAGGKPAWVLGSLVGVPAFVAYPLVRGFWAAVVVLGLQALSQGLTEAGRSVYTAAAVPKEVRVRTFAYIRAYLNAGFTVGAGLGAAAIALDSRPGLVTLALLNAAGITVSTVLLVRLPAAAEGETEHRPPSWGVLRDHPYTALAGVFALLFLNDVLFREIVPLWAITMTDVPRPVLGALFALNTVLAVLLQVPATRGAGSMTGSARLARRAALVTGVACPVFALSGMTHGRLTVAVLAAGVLLLTGGELWSAAAEFFFVTEVPPPAQRGVYLGALNTITAVFRMIGPATLAVVVIHTGGWGWWLVAGLFAVGALVAGPIVAWVARTPRNGFAMSSALVGGHPDGQDGRSR